LKTTSVGKKAVKSFRRESLFERGGRMESFLSKKEVAEILGVSMSTVNRLISDGMLKMVRISRKRIGISEKDLQEYIDSRKKQSNNLSEDGGRIVYRRYVDEQEVEEISLEQALLLLKENYRDVAESELTKMLNSFLQTPGALYSLKKENVQ